MRNTQKTQHSSVTKGTFNSRSVHRTNRMPVYLFACICFCKGKMTHAWYGSEVECECPSVKCDAAFGRLLLLAWVLQSREGSDAADSGAADAVVFADRDGTELIWGHGGLCLRQDSMLTFSQGLISAKRKKNQEHAKAYGWIFTLVMSS